MNYISGSTLLICLLACSACGASTTGASAAADDNTYSLHYTVSIDTAAATADVRMKLKQSAGQVRELSFSTDGLTLHPDGGDWLVNDSRAQWSPDVKGGTVHWTIPITNRRNDNGYDAWVAPNWAMFRAEDILPRLQSRTARGASSRTTLSFDLPDNWSFVTEHPSSHDTVEVDNPTRRLDQPTGWIAVGDLGVRRETIAGTKVAVVGPKGQSIRRMDMLALLNWALPELDTVLPTPLSRLTIFSAADPMWRGGLSAPASIYIHADRPLISENATSTLLHELMHVALRIDVADQHDWITEGLAEYYSLELLKRSGAITARRFKEAIEDQAAWANQSEQLCGRQSSGADTAFAVTLFRQLDIEINKATAAQSSVDDVLVELLRKHEEIDLAILQEAVSLVLGHKSALLHIDNLPGCSNIGRNGQ